MWSRLSRVGDVIGKRGCLGSQSPKKMTESEEEQQELVLRRRRRVVVTLQAHVRGYLVRKRCQSLKGEYESIVKEIEGDLDWLKWNRHSMPVPVFLPKSVQKPIKARELSVQEPGANKNKLHEKEEALCCQEELLSEKDPGCKMQLPSSLSAEVVVETEAEEERLMGRSPGNACSLPGESEEGKHHNSMSSEWSSMILDMESPRLSEELHFQKVPEMPQAVPDLQRYRKHLAMELLWLQQAIASRKNYLILKQRLGSPE